MKNILCYGGSNTWGYIAGTNHPQWMRAQRYDRDIRWTGVLQGLLGSDYYIIEAGLNGQNTAFDETHMIRPCRNGLTNLPLIMDMHYPLDLVMIMLGTNDARTDFNAAPEQITANLQKMIHFIKSSHLGPDFTAPQVLIIAPPPILKIVPEFSLFFNEASIEKTKRLPALYNELARQEQCYLLYFARS